MWSFAFQKATYCNVKGHILQRKEGVSKLIF